MALALALASCVCVCVHVCVRGKWWMGVCSVSALTPQQQANMFLSFLLQYLLHCFEICQCHIMGLPFHLPFSTRSTVQLIYAIYIYSYQLYSFLSFFSSTFYFINDCLLRFYISVDVCRGEVGASLLCFRQKILSELTLPNLDTSACCHFTVRLKAIILSRTDLL